jgi:hypothetical protein
MSETIGTALVKPKLLDGLLTETDLEAETGWTYRTRLRREAEGLPVVKLGATKFYPADKVRDWILSRVREQTPARGRGRPRKAP